MRATTAPPLRFCIAGNIPAPRRLSPASSLSEEAWTLDLLKKRRRIEAGDLVLTWEPGQASPLDTADIDAGQDIGNVIVQRRMATRG